MTIGIGILANDGIVIASDTQESGSSLLKGEKTKMLSFSSFNLGTPELGSMAGACVISGAGDSGYVRALTEKMGGAFLDNKEGRSEEIKNKLEEILARFYKEHVIPFASFPSKDRPDVELLIGFYRKFHLDLFVTEKTVMTRAIPYKAIGIGSVFAELLLGRLWRMSSAKEAEILAAYIVFMAKESVEYVGKYTQITTIHGAKVIDSPEGSRLLPPVPPLSHTPWARIDAWERSFRTVWGAAEQNTIWELIAEEMQDDDPPNKSKQKGKK